MKRWERSSLTSAGNRKSEIANIRLHSKKAKIARVFIVGNYSRNAKDAKKMLQKISELEFKATYLLTPSGFAIMPWKCSSFGEAARAGMSFAEDLLEGIEIDADHIFLGIDSYSGGLTKPHVELSVVCSPEPWHVTGKIYPTPAQQKGLIKADVDSHFLDLDNRVTILCCHDLSMFNPRSDSTAKGWRRETKEEFRERMKEFNPEIALHHSHYTDTPYTWLASWRNLEREVPSIEHYATSGVYYNEKGVRAGIEETLKLTKKGSVLDVLVDVL